MTRTDRNHSAIRRYQAIEGAALLGSPKAARSSKCTSQLLRLNLSQPDSKPICNDVSHAKHTLHPDCLSDEYFETSVMPLYRKALSLYPSRAICRDANPPVLPESLQDDGFDPEGCVGQISSLYIMSKKYEGEFSTAHRPVVCSFTVSFVQL